MKLFGLIGKNLSHSFSAEWFNTKFRVEGIDALYKNFPLSSVEEFTSLSNSNDLTGLNVTIPYKKVIIPFLSELDESVRKTGAVNTVKFLTSVNKFTIGYNTDYLAFSETILPLLGNRSKALILGTGGAASAVKAALDDLKIAAVFVSRIPGEKRYIYSELNQEIMLEYHVIINCTPLGMFPDVDSTPPIPYQFINSSHLLYDLIYNPDETLFLKRGRAAGAQVMNGRDMLIRQAELAWEIWNTP